MKQESGRLKVTSAGTIPAGFDEEEFFMVYLASSIGRMTAMIDDETIELPEALLERIQVEG